MKPSRLKLVDGTLELLSAALEGRGALERLLGVSVAEGWEGFPEALPVLRAAYEGNPEGHPWEVAHGAFTITNDGDTVLSAG